MSRKPNLHVAPKNEVVFAANVPAELRDRVARFCVEHNELMKDFVVIALRDALDARARLHRVPVEGANE